MRLHFCLALALCALGTAAVPSRADEGFCPMGTADNWLPLTDETTVPELVQVGFFIFSSREGAGKEHCCGTCAPSVCLQHTIAATDERLLSLTRAGRAGRGGQPAAGASDRGRQQHLGALLQRHCHHRRLPAERGRCVCLRTLSNGGFGSSTALDECLGLACFGSGSPPTPAHSPPVTPCDRHQLLAAPQCELPGLCVPRHAAAGGHNL